MSLQYFIYQITKNQCLFLLFRLFIVFLILFFNTQYSLCVPTLQDLQDLPNDEFIKFYFDWINRNDLPGVLGEGEHPLINYLKQETIDKIEKDIIQDFKVLTSSQERQLNLDEIYALKRYASNLLSQPSANPVTLVTRKNSEMGISVLDVVLKHLPDLKNGPFLKNYLDSTDYRHEVKEAIKSFIVQEEKAIAKYISENLFRNIHGVRVTSQQIGN